MAPNYLQVPEPGYEGSFAATSAGGDSNEIVASPHHSNRRERPLTLATGCLYSVITLRQAASCLLSVPLPPTGPLS
jgi:hypothetical protein